MREQGPYWITYQVNGRPQCVTTGSDTKAEARRLLREREHLVDRGAAITARVNRILFDDAAQDLIHDYTTNKRRSWRTLTLRVEKP